MVHCRHYVRAVPRNPRAMRVGILLFVLNRLYFKLQEEDIYFADRTRNIVLTTQFDTKEESVVTSGFL